MGGAVRLEKVANVAIKKAEIFHQLINTDIHGSYGAKLKIQKSAPSTPAHSNFRASLMYAPSIRIYSAFQE